MQGIQVDPDSDAVQSNEPDEIRSSEPTDEVEHPRGEPADEREGEADESTAGPDELPDDGPDLESVSRDDVFFVLSNSRRRHAIRYLNGTDGDAVRLRDLAEWIAAQENDVEPVAVSYKQRKRAYTSLYQSHLPKLDDLGIVRFDRNRGEVRPTGTTGQLERYLETLDGETTADRRPELALAASCCALVPAAWAGLLPSAGVSGYGIAAVVAAVFLIATAARVALDR